MSSAPNLIQNRPYANIFLHSINFLKLRFCRKITHVSEKYILIVQNIVFSAISWSDSLSVCLSVLMANGLHIKEWFCPKRENNERN
jgi:hypothetical protein